MTNRFDRSSNLALLTPTIAFLLIQVPEMMGYDTAVTDEDVATACQQVIIIDIIFHCFV